MASRKRGTGKASKCPVFPAGQQKNRGQDQLSQASTQAAVQNVTLKWKGPTDRSSFLWYCDLPKLKLDIFGKEIPGNFTGKAGHFSTRLTKKFWRLLWQDDQSYCQSQNLSLWQAREDCPGGLHQGMHFFLLKSPGKLQEKENGECQVPQVLKVDKKHWPWLVTWVLVNGLWT